MPSTEAKRQMTKRMRGDGSIYRRGATFWICLYVDGQQQRESAKTGDEATALKYLRNRLKEVHAHELDSSKPFLTQRARRRSVSDLMDALQADLEIRSKWNPQARTTSDHVTRAFGSMRATSLRAEDVDDYVKQRLAEGYAKATVNHSLQLLKQAFKLAELPAPKIRRLDDSDNKRRGFFIELEVRRVMANLSAELADFTLFAWLTGMRKGEISSLRWEDVVGNELRLRSENSKNGEARVIPFEGELAELIERRKKARTFKIKEVVMISPFIFHRKGEPISEFRKSWKTACCLAGLGRMVCPKCAEAVDAERKCAKCNVERKLEELAYQGRIFHDLRRSAARNMLNAGVPQAIAMQITGHRTDSMFRRYAIVAPNDVRTALRMTQEHTANEMKSATASVN